MSEFERDGTSHLLEFRSQASRGHGAVRNRQPRGTAVFEGEGKIRTRSCHASPVISDDAGQTTAVAQTDARTLQQRRDSQGILPEELQRLRHRVTSSF